MIVVDTSALMAILKDEPQAGACKKVLDSDQVFLISAGTLTEALIVAAGKDLVEEMRSLMAVAALQCVPVFESDALDAGAAYREWGKGKHPASLNFGDCFAYALAKGRNCPLLFVGNDFSQTDIRSAL